MSKKNQTKKPQPFNAGSKTAPSTRSDGYTPITEERTDLAGYWAPEHGPIHGKLISAFQFVQKNGKGRGGTRTVFVFDLADPCVALVKVEGGGKELDQLAPRSLCGVISTYGLRHLVSLGGCFIKVSRSATKRTLGNGNDAWSYEVASKPAKGRTLDIRPPLARSVDTQANGTAREPGDDSDELEQADLPF